MKLSWLIGGVVLFLIGLVLTITIIGAIVGIPLILLSVIVFFFGLIIPGKFLRKVLKIALIVLVIFVLFNGITVLFESGKKFWNDNVVTPVLEPFSDECGRIAPMNSKIECDCEGRLLEEAIIGGTEYSCWGECGDCVCSEYNATTGSWYAVDCS